VRPSQERCSREVLSSCAQRLNFGVGSRIVEGDGRIVTAPDKGAAVNYDRPYGYLTLSLGPGCFAQGFGHPGQVARERGIV